MNEHIQIDTTRVPVVVARGGEVLANSRDVAAFFGKDHRNVMQAIDNLIVQDPSLTHADFSAGVYSLPATGAQQHRCFEMTRDGFTLVAMGFTGAKALKWKRAYIAAFNAMEAELRHIASAPAIDLNDPAQLRGLLLNYSDRAEKAEQQVQQLMPSVEALNRIATADGSLCITDAAKTLQMRPKDLFGHLRARGWIYRRPGTAHDVAYQDKIAGGHLEHKVTTVSRSDGTEKIVEQVRVTPRGMERLARDVAKRQGAE